MSFLEMSDWKSKRSTVYFGVGISTHALFDFLEIGLTHV